MKRQNLKVNLVLQTLYQIIVLVIPLITAPFLTRRLGDTELGTYTFTYTIAYYFVLFAMLGINKYGQRLISTSFGDDIQLRKNFWSLYFAHIIFSILSLIIYELLILFIGKSDYTIYLIQSLFVLSALFDVTWLFYGLENFKSIVIRNAIIKIIECILIFSLIKTSSDLWIYTIITSVSVLLGHMIMIPFVLKNIKPIKFSIEDFRKHFKPLFIFSIMVISSLMYAMFDKTLLGIFASKEDVAYYEYANKIINVPKTIAVVIGTVIFPRACLKYNEGNYDELNKYYKISLIFTYFISFASFFGILAIGDEFAVLYYGENFSQCGTIMKYLTPVVFLITVGIVLQNIFLIPTGRENKLTLCIVVGAITNVIISSILIPFFGIIGAIIGTLISESVYLCLQFILCRKDISIKSTFLFTIPFIVSGVLMYFLIILIKKQLRINYINLIIIVSIAAVIYLLLCSLYLFFFDKDKKTYRQLFKSIIPKRR